MGRRAGAFLRAALPARGLVLVLDLVLDLAFARRVERMPRFALDLVLGFIRDAFFFDAFFFAFLAIPLLPVRYCRARSLDRPRPSACEIFTCY